MLTRGVKTSEFWLSLLAIMVGSMLAAGVFPIDHWSAKVAGGIVAGLATMGYGISRGMAKAVLLLAFCGLVLTAGCATEGASKVQPATATTTTGTVAQTARDQESAGGTYMGIGGDTVYHIHPAPGVTVPAKISDAVAKVIESDATIESKTLFLDTLGRIYGFTVEINSSGSEHGNVDLAGSTGSKGGIPPVSEPDDAPVPK